MKTRVTLELIDGYWPHGRKVWVARLWQGRWRAIGLCWEDQGCQLALDRAREIVDGTRQGVMVYG